MPLRAHYKHAALDVATQEPHARRATILSYTRTGSVTIFGLRIDGSPGCQCQHTPIMWHGGTGTGRVADFVGWVLDPRGDPSDMHHHAWVENPPYVNASFFQRSLLVPDTVRIGHHMTQGGKDKLSSRGRLKGFPYYRDLNA